MKSYAVASVLFALVAAADQPSCVPLLSVTNYNAIIYGNYQGSSDVQGKIAIQGDASFASGYSVGDQVTDVKNCSAPVTVVGGKLTWPLGRNYFGTIVVGNAAGSSVAPTVLEQGCSVQEKANYYDFAGSKQQVTSMSVAMAAMQDTGVKVTLDANLAATITFTGAQVEVMTIDAMYLAGGVKTIGSLVNLAANAMIIVNVKGTQGAIQNMDMEAFKGKNVVFNFAAATSLTIGGVAVHGSVVAPMADIKDATGVVYGAIACASLTGPMQINVPAAPLCVPSQVLPVTDTQPAQNGSVLAASNVVTKCRLRPVATPTPSNVDAASATAPASVPTPPCTSTVIVDAANTDAPAPTALPVQKCKLRPQPQEVDAASQQVTPTPTQPPMPKGYSY